MSGGVVYSADSVVRTKIIQTRVFDRADATRIPKTRQVRIPVEFDVFVFVAASRGKKRLEAKNVKCTQYFHTRSAEHSNEHNEKRELSIGFESVFRIFKSLGQVT